MMFTLGFGRTWTGRLLMGCMDVLVNICSRLSAAVLLIAGIPVMGVLFLLHLATNRDGGPFLYKGVRLGKGKRLLTIYKIRSLVVNAESQLQGKLHEGDSAMQTPMGGFLRKTRLDELPQLFNVLRGEMAFVGPRPERPSVYESVCKDIPGYDMRFMVKPGLTGLSQFLTPHGTSKRLRTKIDAMLLRKMRNPFWRVYLLAWTGVCVMLKVASEGAIGLKGLVRQYAPPPIMLRSFDPGHRPGHVTLLQALEVTQDRISLISESAMHQGQVVYLQMFRRHGQRMRSARCRGVVTGMDDSQLNAGRRHPAYVVQYEPLSEHHEYRLERYILQLTVA